MGQDKSKHPVAGEDIYVPFGHFSDGGRDAGLEPLIARKPLRDYLIRRLVFGGRQLTCLVTGRRGMGKTSFVRYCLQEYESHVYERFRRSIAGKSLTDCFALLLIIVLSAALAVFVSRIAMVLMMPSLSGGLMFSRFIGGLLILALILPIVFVFKYWARANRRRSDPLTVWGQWADLLCFLGIMAWMAFSLAETPLSLMHAAVQLVVVYMPVSMFWRCRDSSRGILYCASGSGMPLTYLGVALAILCPQPLGHSGLASTVLGWLGDPAELLAPTTTAVQFVRKIVSVVRPTSEVVWQFDSWWVVPPGLVAATVAALAGGKEKDDSGPEPRWTARIRALPALWRLLLIIPLLVVLGVPLTTVVPLMGWCAPAAALIIVALGFYGASRVASNSRKLRPAQVLRAQFILRLRAVVVLATVITLAAPPLVIALKHGMNTNDVHDGTTIGMIVGSVVVILIAEFIAIARIFGPYGACEEIAEKIPADTGKDPFHDSDRVFWCRNLERATLAWQYYRVYVPAVTVSINLGFDDLDHRKIIHAMLVALRNEYQKAFREWDAPLLVATRILGGAAILVLVMLISTSFFFGLPREIGIGGKPCAKTYELGPKKLSDLKGVIRQEMLGLADNNNVGQKKEVGRIIDGDINFLRMEVHSKVNALNIDDEQKKRITEGIGVVDISKAIVVRDGVGGGKKTMSNKDVASKDAVVSPEDELLDAVNILEEKFRIIVNVEKIGGVKEIGDIEVMLDTAKRIAKIKRIQGAGADLLCALDSSERLSNIAYFAIVPMPELSLWKKKDDGDKAVHSKDHDKPDKGLKENSRLFRMISGGDVVEYGESSVNKKILAIYQGEAPISVRVYHLVLAVILFLIGRETMGRFLPYGANLRRIDDLLDGLTAKSVDSYGHRVGEWARWLRNRFGGVETRSVERAPVDSRVIEESFIRVLTECTMSMRKLPGGRRMWLGMPAPEITFVFDELDKFWAKAPSNDAGGKEHLAVNAERGRATAAARLLSDLKRLISDSPARAIFVGGRLLHDGWLADMHARSQILTSIFDAEIYLPSLLTDTSSAQSSGNVWLDRLVIAYIERRHEIAKNAAAERRRQISAFLPWVRRLDTRKMLYFNHVRADYPERPIFHFKVGKAFNEKHDPACPGAWQRRLTYDLAHYLTYRSGGSPKRLREMLAAQIRPAGEGKRDEDVLVLGPVPLLKMQFVADIYRHLTQRLERRLAFRDDKVVLSALSLTDHLFKFHRRAFNLSNIERMEEVAHIHHAPDIRNLLGEIVDHFQSRFLRPVVNGMYDYRFRSEIAHEIEHLSRYSESEMAAFNFALDESQSLKASYEAMLQGNDCQCMDALAALGELHEYDQEYDLARTYYGRALSALPGDGSSPGSPKRLAWSLTRLRLILQIGMTYEQGANLERAEGEYVAAHHLAREILREFLETHGAGTVPEMEAAKHASLLYQPLFAEAWAAEKLWNDIDTSTLRIEKGLVALRQMMPFVSFDDTIPLTRAPHQPAHASFALIISDLHHKAGDLYFIKGRQVAVANEIDSYARDVLEAIRLGLPPVELFEGYLLRAAYHYSLAMHEVRRYVHHRIESSTFKLTLRADGGRTLASGNDPTYSYRSAAGTINNLADALLARVSPAGLVLSGDVTFAPNAQAPTLWQVIQNWLAFGHEDANSATALVRTASGAFDFGCLSDWLGAWAPVGEQKLAFDRVPRAEERLLFAIELSIAAAEARRLSGAPEDAASDLILAARTCVDVLWSLRIRLHLRNGTESDLANLENHLATTGLVCLRQASELLLGSKRDRFPKSRGANSDRVFTVGAIIPPEMLTLACSLGLGIPDALYEPGLKRGLLELLGLWDIQMEGGARLALRDLLFDRLRENRYPLANRLLGIKVLLDSALIDGERPVERIDGTMVHRLFVEFEEVFSRFAAPTLFGFSRAGQTAALYALDRRSEVDHGEGPFSTRREIHRVAHEWLQKGLEMFTHGAAYYEAIRNLYYLYDDFNDRRTHHARATEMAGWEISVELLDHLDRHSPLRESNVSIIHL